MGKKSNKNILIAVIAAGIIVAAGAGVAFSNTFAQKPQQQTDEEFARMVFQKMQSPTIAAAPVLGNASAPVTVVEFGDYLCTFCHRFHEDTKDKLMADYVETGKARFVFKDFPINDHLGGGSSLGAQASYCAADQGKFWEFHDFMYNNWGGERAGWITKENMADFAQKVGVSNVDQFKSCLDSGKYASAVKDNYNMAKSVGLGATPSFVIIPAAGEPKLVVGAQPYQVFQQVIDESS
ncbi:protein-disulfide isomerase [Candidatus Nitrososphaera evergladensis SR1]|jgi:protein-disulfide isomerase|uniref:Protein-disulfide isomerase n=1 Tax=Candidatus Nitrososphaera evergladensis SR1 TaxID=1459636 RepID=A0A075MTF2_9ARCH|nr:thioredoxin domain-containing protein [Candidatus Nitrososphaera evergladensis]AIF84480.1 protein-disulfide isomerase [Candidatus Nitrososphaera evergladensis SR1]